MPVEKEGAATIGAEKLEDGKSAGESQVPGRNYQIALRHDPPVEVMPQIHRSVPEIQRPTHQGDKGIDAVSRVAGVNAPDLMEVACVKEYQIA